MTKFGPNSRSGSSSSFKSSRSQSRRSSSGSSRSATGICLQFLHGKCTYGKSCRYKHDHQAVAAAAALYEKDQRRKEPCAHFSQGTCKFGNKCIYSHSQVAAPAPVGASSSSKSKRSTSRDRRSSSSERGKRENKSKKDKKDKKDKKPKKEKRDRSSSRERKKRDPAAAVAEIMGEFEDAYSAAVAKRDHHSDSDNDSNGICSSLKHYGLVGTIASDSEASDASVSAASLPDSLKGYESSSSSDKDKPKVCKSVTFGFVDFYRHSIVDPSGKQWKKVIRRSRSPTYKHANAAKKKLAGNLNTAIDAAIRLALELGVSDLRYRRRELRTRSVDRGYKSLGDKKRKRSESVPSMPVFRKSEFPEEFIADTGSGLHLIPRHALSDAYIRRAKLLEKTMKLNTANGSITVDKSVGIPFKSFQEMLDCIILEDTPPVISVGERCENKGYAFHWCPFDKPFFICPGVDSNGNKRIIRCTTKRHVPTIKAGTPVRQVSKAYLRRLLQLSVKGDSDASSGHSESEGSSHS